MKQRISSSQSVLFLFPLFLIIIVITASFRLWAPEPQDAQQAVRDSWRLMQQVGVYEFSASVEQTTFPAPKLTNVGRSSVKENYYVTGQADTPNGKLLLTLFQNQGSLLDGNDGIQIKVQDGTAWGRMGNGEWEIVEAFSTAGFAPGNDAASFLSAARRVAYLGTVNISLPSGVISARRYRFDLDGRKFSEQMRDQMVRQLQRTGKLPAGMHLDASDIARRMSGEGEVFLSSDGLPLRMALAIKFPPERNGQHVEAIIKTDFYNHKRDNLLANQPWHLRLAGFLAGLSGFPQNSAGIREYAFNIQVVALVAALVTLMVVFSAKKPVYIAVAALVIFAMLFSPLWQSVKAAQFTAEQRQKSAAQQLRQQQKEEQQQWLSSQFDKNWNPTQPAQIQLRNANNAADTGRASRLAGGFAQPLLAKSLAPLAADAVEDDDSKLDTDQDGVTDEFEKRVTGDPSNPDKYDPGILDYLDPDTDDDGLTDGEELSLDMMTGDPDTDGDKIPDLFEVKSFYTADRDWWSNPLDRDTDGDTILDGVECPQRVNTATPGLCQDTDGDKIPDIFDIDDDNDGVLSSVDESPYTVSTEVYHRTNPFLMRVASPQPNQEVYITYQIVPTDTRRLTFAMNVLDWPSGDNDGQIMRVSDTTFADYLTSSQRENDPRAANGDLRLMPMLEIKLTGATIPLPFTNTFTVAVTATLGASSPFIGEFRLTGQPGGAQVQISDGPAGAHPVYAALGDCDNFRSVQKLGLLTTGGAAVSTFIPLGDFVDDQHVLYVMNSAETEIRACVQVPAKAHGTFSDQIVDSSMLNQYGASARNDYDGSVLIYAPLTLVSDATGATPQAFQSKIPFYSGANGFNDSLQNIRAVWLVNMLTDVCKPIPVNYSESDDGTWCDGTKAERWDKDIERIVHSYSETFRVSGISVQEELGVDMAVVFEDPSTDPDPQYDDPLWKLASGLEASFLAGRDVDGNGNRDLTVAEIQRRFDPDFNAGLTTVERWGTDIDAFEVERYQYSFSDGVVKFMQQQALEIFDTYFNGLPTPREKTTLLFAREVKTRGASFGESAVTCTGGVCTFDLSGQAETVQAIVNWSPYRYDGSQWQPYPIEEYLDNLEANLRLLDAYKPADESSAEKAIVDAQIFWARYYYQSIYMGLAMLVQLNNNPVINDLQLLEDQDIYDQYSILNGAGQAVQGAVTSAVDKLVELFTNNAWLASALKSPQFSKWDKVSTLAYALYDENVPGFLKSIFKSKIGTALLIVGVTLLVAAIAVHAVFFYLGDQENFYWQEVGGRVFYLSLGVLSTVLAISGLVEAVGWLQAGKGVSAGASKASIVGAVIGVIIAWGVFFVAWGLSGAKFGSLAVNNMIADAIATTIVVVLYAVLSATVIGTIIVAILGIIDGLIAIACAAAGFYKEKEDHWARQYFCIGITGWLTKIIKWTIYSQTYMVNYASGDRLSFTGLSQSTYDEELGMVVGNPLSYTMSLSNTIELTDIFDPENWETFDWKSAVYFWQFSDSTAKSTTFKYLVQPSKNNIHEDLERGSMSSKWISLGDHKFVQAFDAKTNGFSITMPEPGINRDPSVYMSEGAAIPVQECWGIPVYIFMSFILVPICYVRTERMSVHNSMSTTLTVDVFPADLDDFYSLAEIGETGYTLGWGQDATLTFGAQKDADGDTLISQAFNGDDPDDSRYDTDSDGLSDAFEVQRGYNPRLFDTDDDGLTDAEEVRYGTDPTRKDSDGDGLPDGDEIAGWLFTYGFLTDGTPKETMVYPDPLKADTDYDGLTDLQERIYGFNPRVPSTANILDYTMTVREQDAPLALWRFEEAANASIFMDESGFNYHASCLEPACPLSAADGRFGFGADFDGADGLVVSTSAMNTSFVGNRPFTFAAWVFNDGGGTILSKWSQVTDYKQEVRFELNGNQLRLLGNSATVSGPTIPANTWTHVAVSFDGSQARFYINGSMSGSAAFANNPSFPGNAIDSEIIIGAYMGTSDLAGGFNGRLDEVVIFDRALSAAEIGERLQTARYNLNDQFVRPGESINYKSVVENLLNSRYAFGLLSTLFNPKEAVVDYADKLTPVTFQLKPDNPVLVGINTFTYSDTLQIDANWSVSTPFSITQTASAQIVDLRSESNFAELWLQFDESSGTKFEDASGSIPPRQGSCSACPTVGVTGILNRAIQFNSSANTPVTIPSLGTMKMVDRGYTVVLWVRPSSGASSSMTLVKSAGNQFSFNIAKDGSGNYVPQVYVNGAAVTDPSPTLWRTILPDVWSHLAVVYSSGDSRMDIFVNGARVRTIHSVPAINANADLTLGGSPQSANYLVDDLRIFSRPLSVLDINKLAERPVLEMHMDTTSFPDSSVYNHAISVGPAINSKVNTPALQVGTSVRGNAMNPGYPGAGVGYVKVNGNTLLNMQDGAFTFSTWVYPTNAATTSAWQGIFGYNTGYASTSEDVNAYPGLERRNQQLRFVFGDGSTYQSKESGNVLSIDQWNHVVVTFKERETAPGNYEYKLYVNSRVVDSNIFSSKPSNSSGNSFFVGHSSYKYISKAVRFYVQDHGDAGDTAEVWIERYLDDGSQRCIYPTLDNCSNQQDVDSGQTFQVDYSEYVSNYATVRFDVWEDDWGLNPDDFCGRSYHYWYEFPGDKTVTMSDGFDGTFTVNLARPTVNFVGYIDELEVYRYAIDSEQVFDLYNSVPITARLPLDDRPGSDTFVNRARIGALDDGVCAAPGCPAAGTVGLIN